MRCSKTERFGVALGVLLVLSAAVCVGSEQAPAAKEITPVPMVAHFHLSGVLSEKPMADPFGFMAGEVTSLKDLVRRIGKASTDDRVKAVVLTFDRMQLGFGQLEELRRAIEGVKSAGKKVYAYAEDMSTAQYGLLCASDRLCVGPQSTLWLTGLYGESLYVKGLLDKIGVQADFLHMGDYKSAAEMLTRTGPSQPAEENTNWLLDSLYGSLVDMIARSRGKTAEQVRAWIDQGPYVAEQAKEKGLIDAIQTREEFLAQVKSELGGQAEVDNRYGQGEKTKINLASPLGFFSLLSELFKAPAAPTSQKDAVAVVYVEGAILPGYRQPTLFGAYEAAYSGDIRNPGNAAQDGSVEAVVMRRCGGSAQAST
jgi:protease-4